MNNLKSNSKINLLLLSLFVFLLACDDEDKDLLAPLENANTAPFAKFTENNPPTTVGLNDIADLMYSFSVDNPNKTMVLYDLEMYAVLSGVQTETVQVDQATSFPVNYTFTDEDLAGVLGIETSEINFGDQFFFTATSQDASGSVYGGAISQNSSQAVFLLQDETFVDADGDPVNDLDGNPISLNTPGVYKIKDGTADEYYYVVGQGSSDDLLSGLGYRQAYEFNFIILCPPPANVEDFVGTWSITVDPFDTCVDDCVFEFVAGPGENQVTAIDFFDHQNPDTGGTYDVVFDFNPNSGEISVARQPAWHCDNFGCNFGEGRVDGGGYIFNCVGNGLIKLTLQHTVDAGSFGSYALDMVKQ